MRGHAVRSATEGDIDARNTLRLRVHVYDRGPELLDAIKQGTATVVEHHGRIMGYATMDGWGKLGKAIIGAAEVFVVDAHIGLLR